MSPLEITNEDLHAYVDGALDKNRIADLELWLSNHPEDNILLSKILYGH